MPKRADDAVAAVGEAVDAVLDTIGGDAQTRSWTVIRPGGVLASIVGLLLGGALTEYLSWRWTLYVNLAFAGVVVVSAGNGGVTTDGHPVLGKALSKAPTRVLVSPSRYCMTRNAVPSCSPSRR
mgnify:CR=1 FL=1